ncbi:hypothetical protein NIES4071_69280 [Calothrix sp. NIES-4071]|nr:hypothetical protein NIES4071_69280 [Calothrix sp. NIES-4071]BAZ61205.1 hypothetical protein NIES4105_69230 [Calothrix sp. NIES-4105]
MLARRSAPYPIIPIPINAVVFPGSGIVLGIVNEPLNMALL